MENAILIIMFIIGIVAVIWGSIVKLNSEITRINGTGISVEHKSGTYEITAKARGPVWNKLLVIEEDRINTWAEKPDEYVFRAVTVGSATTGGIEKREGYSYLTSSTKTGKYVLLYKDYSIKTKVQVNKICLTEELAKQARKSNIAKYMSGNDIIVNKTVELKGNALTALENGNISLGTKLYEKDAREGYPTKEKCEEIKRWLATIG